MRLSLVISAAIHVVLVVGLLLVTPRRFEPPVEQIEVELIPEKDAPNPPEEKKAEDPKPEKPSVWDFPSRQQPKFDLPRLEITEQGKKGTSDPVAATQQKATPRQ